VHAGNAWRPALAVAGVLTIHFWIVLSIAQQPLGVNAAPPEARSLVWPLYHDSVHRIGPAADLFAVYHAGRAFAAGIDPYGYGRQEIDTAPYFYQFRYLPAVGRSLGGALALASPRAAWWAWIGVLELLLAIGCAAICARTPDPRLRVALFALLYLQSPYFLELHMGQFTFAALCLLALAALLADDGPARTRLAGAARSLALAACFTVSALLKPIALAAAPAWLRRRRDALVLAAALCVIVASNAPDFASHPERWRSFSELNLGHPPGGMHSGNHGLTYLVFLALRDLGLPLRDGLPPAFLVVWRYAWLGLAAALVLGSRCRSVVVGANALVLAHFLGFAHVWEHHASGCVVLGAALLAALAREPELHDRRAIAVALGALVALALPTPFALFDTVRDPLALDPPSDWPPFATYLCAASKALPSLLLFAVCAHLLWRQGWRRRHGALEVPVRAGS
jgi:hypothetical protein